MKIVALFILYFFLGPCLFAKSSKPDYRIPDEYEATGGNALGFANSGSVAFSDVSSVRANPGMLALESQYAVSAGYNWPTNGRDFYQAGVVDTKTSKFAAGFSFTGFQDDLEKSSYDFEDRDALTEKRLALAVAYPLKFLSVGLGGQYVRGAIWEDGEFETKKGPTLNVGAVGLLTKTIRVGVSAENLNNRKVEALAPRVYRGGIAWLILGGDVSLNLDYRNRQRISFFESDPSIDRSESLNNGYSRSEQLVVGSFSTRLYNLLRIYGAYGEAFSEDKRRLASMGIALVNQNFSISYNVSRPYLEYSQLHSSLNLSLILQI